jgi:hypothetical protein
VRLGGTDPRIQSIAHKPKDQPDAGIRTVVAFFDIE